MKQILLAILLVISIQSFSEDPGLNGSKPAQRRANCEANREKLPRIKNDRELRDSIKAGFFVPITKTVRFDDPKDFDLKFRFLLPQANKFVIRIESAFQQKFGTDRYLQLNSAVRTVVFQTWLEHHNRNAAKPKGNRRSAHLTGAALDFTKCTMTAKEIAWMRSILLSLEKQHLIEATEESCQSVFHIMVFKSYLAYAKKMEHPSRKIRTSPKHKG